MNWYFEFFWFFSHRVTIVFSTLGIELWLGCCPDSYYRNYYVYALPSNQHYSDVIMGAVGFQITCASIARSTVYSGGNQRNHQSSAPLAFVRGIHRWPVDFPHKGSVTKIVSIAMTSSWSQPNSFKMGSPVWNLRVPDFLITCSKLTEKKPWYHLSCLTQWPPRYVKLKTTYSDEYSIITKCRSVLNKGHLTK